MIKARRILTSKVTLTRQIRFKGLTTPRTLLSRHFTATFQAQTLIKVVKNVTVSRKTRLHQRTKKHSTKLWGPSACTLVSVVEKSLYGLETMMEGGREAYGQVETSLRRRLETQKLLIVITQMYD